MIKVLKSNNPCLIRKSASQLVDITHKWDCRIIASLFSKKKITESYDSVYIVMKNEIEDIYNRLNIYLIEGTFRKDFNYEKIKELLHSQQSKLDDFNIESDQYPECRKMFQGLIKDIQKIWYLNQFFNEKREDNYVFMKRDDTEYDNI